MEDVDVYDLGEAGGTKPRAAYAPKFRRARPRLAPSPPRASGLPAASASMSLLLPGSGQLVAGEPAAALFFASSFACVASLGWAIVTEIDRLVPTLLLLDLPPRSVLAALAALFAAACALHSGGVVHAHRVACRSRHGAVPHPILAGLASAAVPGWGQIVAGHRVRSTLFLAALWLLAGAWLAVSPLAEGVLSTTGDPLPAFLRGGIGSVVLVSLSGIAWAVAVYDAAAGASAARRD